MYKIKKKDTVFIRFYPQAWAEATKKQGDNCSFAEKLYAMLAGIQNREHWFDRGQKLGFKRLRISFCWYKNIQILNL